ncbi:uncharacterized protein LOC126780409 [Nymphalis io]|uniref:uncharacterized protein LOC126780409 n=1 Tax=Inachis io TaxID=171585 RepID=UPI00216A683F|nr:uncharacterized protein LOC126780409 [Nymphalis io]
MLKNSALETDMTINSHTMDEECELDVIIEPDFISESSSDDETESSADNMSDYYYDNIIAESLADNMFNLSVESDLEDDDDDCDLSPYASSRGPPIPFVFNDYPEDDAGEIDLDFKISKIGGLDHVAVNSPMWYAQVRPHLTQEEREELWDRTPWNCQTMSNEYQEEVRMQQHSSSEASSNDRSAPTTDNTNRYYYKKVIAESLEKNMFNLSLGLDLDDDDCDLSPYASSRGPPLPFVFNNYLDNEDDSEESGIDYKISKIGGLDHVAMNSPHWYALVRPHLTLLEREELWDRTPWAVKFYWGESDDTDAEDGDPVPSSLFKDQSNF